VDPEPLRFLQLNCLVLGDDHHCVFPVEIAPTKTVGALKKAIKEEKKHAFRNVDADILLIWEVSIPVDGNLKKNLNNLKLADGRSLSPVDELLEVFSGEVTKKHVHIVIKVPAGELETHWPQQQF
jgi:Crinkler effector protein N-terminal domain